MCVAAVCANEGCGKTTYKGCGRHIEAVMANVAEADQCKCTKEEHNPK